MQLVADLHLHSKYSRAVSKEMELKSMAEWGRKKGIDLLATGDWTHPLWQKEIESKLEEDGEGIYKVKGSESLTRFVLSGEISNIYTKGGKGRRVHTVFMVPSIETMRKVNEELKRRGGNLLSDGRPILGFSMEEMCEMIWGVDEGVIVIPAHIWTPWFAMFGSKSGFDSVEECFSEYADRIMAVETGLSSDPVANWRIKDLENRALVSFSDAHSPRKMAREATVFDFKGDKFNFEDLRQGMARQGSKRCKIAYTIEFHPEEGKYYYTGHRNCKVVQSPQETRKKGTICHVCGRALTVGVLHRIEKLAEVKEDMKIKKVKNNDGVMEYFHPKDKTRPPFVYIVPLQEVVAEAIGQGVNTKGVQELYERLISKVGNEFEVLLKKDIKEIEKVGGERVAEAIFKVRSGQVLVEPGYDGVFGVVKIWGEEKEEGNKIDQQMLF